jgi:CDP-diacylglycerol--glycerol-3-phosphate 3-phosphatidyltransferase
MSVGIYAVKPAFQRLLQPVARRLAAGGVGADALTWAGLAFSSVAGAGFWLGRDGAVWLLAVPSAALLRTAANALDGLVAVQAGSSHPRGEVFNEVSDRVGDTVIFLPVMAVAGVPDPLVAASLSCALITSFLGNAAKAAGGSRIYAGVMGKPDRMFVLGLGALVAFVADDHAAVIEWSLWVVLVGSLATFLVRVRLVRKTLP